MQFSESELSYDNSEIQHVGVTFLKESCRDKPLALESYSEVCGYDKFPQSHYYFSCVLASYAQVNIGIGGTVR